MHSDQEAIFPCRLHSWSNAAMEAASFANLSQRCETECFGLKTLSIDFLSRRVAEIEVKSIKVICVCLWFLFSCAGLLAGIQDPRDKVSQTGAGAHEGHLQLRRGHLSSQDARLPQGTTYGASLKVSALTASRKQSHICSVLFPSDLLSPRRWWSRARRTGSCALRPSPPPSPSSRQSSSSRGSCSRSSTSKQICSPPLQTRRNLPEDEDRAGGKTSGSRRNGRWVCFQDDRGPWSLLERR